MRRDEKSAEVAPEVLATDGVLECEAASVPSSALAVAPVPPEVCIDDVPEYWEVEDLALRPTTQQPKSKGATRSARADVQHPHVAEVQRDLNVLGYYKPSPNGVFDADTAEAVSRLQRHARRPYRMDTGGERQSAVPYSGVIDGAVNTDFAKEIRRWIENEWVLPFAYFTLEPIRTDKTEKQDSAKLRLDAAIAWEQARAAVEVRGGLIRILPGSALRPFDIKPESGDGKSWTSLHYCGRAIDLMQDPAASYRARHGEEKLRHYYVVREDRKEDDGQRTYWRLYSRCELQDGTQGTLKTNCDYYDFETLRNLPIPGDVFVVDVTALLEAYRFKRIPAHTDWQRSLAATDAKKRVFVGKLEWWHYKYEPPEATADATFQDEMELIGVGADELRKFGWSRHLRSKAQ